MAVYMRKGMPTRDLIRFTLTRIVPLGLAVGAAMETTMYYTMFWDVATRKEAERRLEKQAQLKNMQEQLLASGQAPNSSSSGQKA